VEAGISTGPNYGGCLYQSRLDDRLYFIATSEEGIVGQYELKDDGNSHVIGERVREWPLGKCEAAVADDATGVLYVGEESQGIWKLGAEPGDPVPGTLISRIGEHGIEGDIEGLALVPTGADTGYLVMSDQGASRFHVFRREGDNDHLGSFQIQTAAERRH
jgi:3-phytase